MEQKIVGVEVLQRDNELPLEFQSACLRCDTDPDSIEVINHVSQWASEKGIKMSFIPVSGESDPGYAHLNPYEVIFVGGALIEARTLDSLKEQLQVLSAWLVENI